MHAKTFSVRLKVILAGCAVCGLLVFLLIVPAYGRSLVSLYPEFSNRFWPWLVFLWAAAAPCFAALVLAWRIASEIGRDRPFTPENARRLALISRLAAGDAVFFLVGNIVLLFLNMSHPGIVLLSLLIVFFGAAVSVVAAALAGLAGRAAVLQEENDLTI